MSLTKLKTGPKTLAGKKRSAQNAIKTGLYTATLIASESVEHYLGVRESMIEDLEAYDAIGITAVDEFAMTAVRKNRVIKAEAQYLAGVMQTDEARKALAEKLHGSQSFARLIPWWFLKSANCQEKKDAVLIRLALKQLDKLKAAGGQPNDQAIAFSYPQLHEVVSWYKNTNSETFWQAMARETQKQHVSTCLEAFAGKLQKVYEHYIEWAENAHRYQCVVEMVYAEFAMRFMSKPEMIKLNNALNRQAEHALAVLHARGQLFDANQGAITVQAAAEDGSVGEVHIEAPQEGKTSQAGAPSAESEPGVEHAQGGETAEPALNVSEPADSTRTNAAECETSLHESDSGRAGKAVKAVACASEPQVDSETASGDGRQKPDLKAEEQEMD